MGKKITPILVTQKILLPERVVKCSRNKDPAKELPDLSRSFDHTARVISLGITAIMPLPTPLLAEIPTL